MNAGGQLAGLNFPNWTGFSGQVLNQGPDRDVNVIMIRAYNDWHVDEWCGAYPERFIPCGILPLFDVERAANEVHRLAAKGCHAVTFSENPEALGMPSIHSRYWDPLFAACSRRGDGAVLPRRLVLTTAHTSADAPASVAMSLVVGRLHLHHGRPDLVRRLRPVPRAAVLAHRGRRRLDPLLPVARRARPRPTPRLDRPQLPRRASAGRPTCSGATSCAVSSATRSASRTSLTSTWTTCAGSPTTRTPTASGRTRPEVLAELLAGVSDEVVDGITHGNAMRHYQFDPFARRPPDACRVGALRAESPDVDTVTRVGRPGR